MERRLALILLFGCFMLMAASGQNVVNKNYLRIYLWADEEAYPGLVEAERLQSGVIHERDEYEKAVLSVVPQEDEYVFDPESRSDDAAAAKDDYIYAYSVLQMKKLAPYIINGMVYGWEFVYTPSDSTRGVSEYFEVKPLRDFSEERKLIKYETAIRENSKLHVWVSFKRNSQQRIYYQQWADLQNQKISGIGSGKVEKGFAGINEACDEALKVAVRGHFQKIMRNKPKQITGRVLISDIHGMTVDKGHYKVQLDYFLETVKIKEYNLF